MALILPNERGGLDITYFAITTGTHSAGKSTLVNSLSDPSFEIEHGIDSTTRDPFGILPKLGGCALEIEGKLIPVITGEEASTFYVRQADNPSLVTDGYTFEHQIMMETMAHDILTQARIAAGDIAAVLQPDSPTSRSIVLLDRFTADGQVYSTLRAPEEDQEMINFGTVQEATLGHRFNTMPGLEVPFRAWNRTFIRNYCDLVLIPDHNEVEFEDNGLRQVDLTFRDTVASDMHSIYATILNKRNIRIIRGNPDARKVKTVEALRQIVINDLS